MGIELYVANFPPTITEEQLRTLFAEHGEVTAVRLGVEEPHGVPYAVVEMASEKVATKAYHALNGYRLGGQALAVSYPEPDLTRELTARQRKTVEEIAATLEETEKVPVRQIEAIVRLCGAGFARAILNEALEVDAGAGLMTSDETRRRTKGGIFFFLARFRMSPPVRRIIYNRKGKIPAPGEPKQDESE